MFGKLFNFWKKPPKETFVIAQLNERIGPAERVTVYEETLDRVLRQNEVGEITGGGTMMGASKEIENIDIEICLSVPPEKALDLIRRTLEELGAPKGSKLSVEADEEREIPFGVSEGLAVYLNGTDLPDEVYKTCDSNVVISEFKRLLGEDGSYRGHWQGPKETALYFVGPSFEGMCRRLKPFLDSYPLCRKARLVQTA